MTVNSPGNKSVVWVTEYVVRNRRTLTSCAQVSFAYQNIDPRNAKQILEMLIIRALREECGQKNENERFDPLQLNYFIVLSYQDPLHSSWCCRVTVISSLDRWNLSLLVIDRLRINSTDNVTKLIQMQHSVINWEWQMTTRQRRVTPAPSCSHIIIIMFRFLIPPPRYCSLTNCFLNME